MPHLDHSASPTRDTLARPPPFSESVSTAPLLRISLEKLVQQDFEQGEQCWRACCDLGFFYLDVLTSDARKGIDGAALLQDVAQLFKISKDEHTGIEKTTAFSRCFESAPPPLPILPQLFTRYLHARRFAAIFPSAAQSSVRNSGGLAALDKLNAVSGDQIRFVKAPPQEQLSEGVALSERADFGSVTVLFNRLGGLQVRLPESIEPLQSVSSIPASTTEQGLCKHGWAYVCPLPGHCIINLGDALVKLTSSKLRSNIHRMVAPLGERGKMIRYSFVYFCRPEGDVKLKSLVEGRNDAEAEDVYAKEWILRRALGRRKGDGWEESGGTEGASMRNGMQLIALYYGNWNTL